MQELKHGHLREKVAEQTQENIVVVQAEPGSLLLLDAIC